MNLKQHFNIVWDTRKFGGGRVAISVNQLEKYIPNTRAEIIRKSLSKFMGDKAVFSVQGKGKIIAYSK